MMDESVVVVPIEDTLDLHTFSPKEVSIVLEEYLWACKEKGMAEVRIVHGKGRGILRDGVGAFLQKSDFVESFHPAPPERGGWGAVIVLLKR